MQKVLIAVLLLIFLIGCVQSPPPTNVTPFPTEVKKGTGFWPMQVDNSYVDNWFSFTQEAQHPIFAIQKGEPFREPALDDVTNYNTALNLALERAKREGYETYLGLEPFSGDRTYLDVNPNWAFSRTPTMLDANWRMDYLTIIEQNIQRHQPTYFNPCIEINMWYAAATTEEWQAFRSLYGEIVTRTKQISPTTKVFCSYQYELMSGKLYGKEDITQWELMDDPTLRLEGEDLLGISSYPYGKPSEIKNWYNELRSRSAIKPIFVAETGFITTDPNEQAQFVGNLANMWAGLPLHALLWLDLTEIDAGVVPGLPYFLYSQGLLTKDFTPKPAWETWKQI